MPNEFNVPSVIHGNKQFNGRANFKSFVTIGAYTLPINIGANGQILVSNGDQSVSWKTVGGVSTTFLALTDTPANYTGEAGNFVKVNAGESDLEFGQPNHTELSNIGTNTHTQIDTHIADTSIHFSDLSGFDTDDLAEGTNLFFTTERVDDQVANLIQNGTGITWTYDDVAGTLTGNVSITQYTDEMAQDAIGAMIADTNTIDLTYTDATPELKADVKYQNTATIDLADDASGLKASLNATLKSNIDLNTASRHSAVTLAGKDYLTLAGQVITANAIDLTDDVSGILPIANGGTNSDTALNNDRVIISSGGKIIESATITVTELGLLNGIASVSTGTGDNDKFVTQGYVDDAVGGENLWDRAGTILSPHTAGDDITTTGKLGIGFLTAPTFGVEIKGLTQNDASVATIYHGNDTTAPFLGTIKYRGTQVSPLAVASGDNLGSIYLAGYNGTTVGVGAAIHSQTTQAWTATHQGSRLLFQTTADDTAVTGDVLLLDQDKSATFYGNVIAGTGLTIGTGAAGVDYRLTFDGENNDGTIDWKEDEDLFLFNDDVVIGSNEKLGIGTTPVHTLHIATTETVTGGIPIQSLETLTANPTGNSSARFTTKRLVLTMNGSYNFTDDGHTAIYGYAMNSSSSTGLINSMNSAIFRSENFSSKTGAGDVALTNLNGFVSEAFHSSSLSKITNATGFTGTVANTKAGQIENSYGALFRVTNYGGGLVENAVGGRFSITNAAGTLTSARGNIIEALPAFANNNETRIALQIEALPNPGAYTGTSVTAIDILGTGGVRDGIKFGSDTNLYRSAANILKTDDKFESANADFGDGTNYTEIKTDGEINLHGTARTTNAVWIDAGGLKAPGLKPATFISHGINGAWQFSDAVAGNEKQISGTIRIPKRMDRGVAPTFTIGWSADGVSPGVCRWQLEYLWTSPNEDTTAAAQETLTIDSTASSTSNGLVLAEITGIDIPSATDACLHFRITRLSAHANDTITDTTELLGVCLGFTSNKLGKAT